MLVSVKLPFRSLRQSTLHHAAIVSKLLVATGFVLWMVKPVGDLRLVFFAYVLVLIGSILGGIGSGFSIDARVFFSFMASILVGTAGAILGVYHDNPGVESEIVFFVLLPIAWMIFAFGVTESTLRVIVNIMPFASLFIGGFGVLYWAHATGRIDLAWITLIDLGQGLGSEQFGYEMRYYPISSLVFLIPFLVMSTIIPSTYTWALSRVVTWPALVSTLMLLFIAGRRAIFVSLAVSVAAVYMLFLLRSHAASYRRRMYAVFASLMVLGTALAMWTGFSFVQLAESIVSGDTTNDQVRTEAAANLLDSWAERPTLGQGWGATISGPPRNLEDPWEFEVQYHLILNAVGLVGFLILGFITVELLARVVASIGSRMETYGYLIPVVAGTISILVANASNPYLHTPGHYWMFFILVIALNTMAQTCSRSSARSPARADRGVATREHAVPERLQ